MRKVSRTAKDAYNIMRRQPSASSEANDVVNSMSVHSDSDNTNDSSLSEPETGGVLSGSLDEIIEADCYKNLVISHSSSKTQTSDKKSISTSQPKPQEHTFARWREIAYGH